MVAYNKSKCKIQPWTIISNLLSHDSHPSSITFLSYRLIARTGGANYDKAMGDMCQIYNLSGGLFEPCSKSHFEKTSCQICPKILKITDFLKFTKA